MLIGYSTHSYSSEVACAICLVMSCLAAATGAPSTASHLVIISNLGNQISKQTINDVQFIHSLPQLERGERPLSELGLF